MIFGYGLFARNGRTTAVVDPTGLTSLARLMDAFERQGIMCGMATDGSGSFLIEASHLSASAGIPLVDYTLCVGRWRLRDGGCRCYEISKNLIEAFRAAHLLKRILGMNERIWLNEISRFLLDGSVDRSMGCFQIVMVMLNEYVKERQE